MRINRHSVLAAMLSVGLVLVLFGPGHAQQSPGNLPRSQASTAVLTDTVVTPDGLANPVPGTTVRWRGWRYGGWNRPYWRTYRYGWYPSYGYRSPRCWWNGYRWKCRSYRSFAY